MKDKNIIFKFGGIESALNILEQPTESERLARAKLFAKANTRTEPDRSSDDAKTPSGSKN